MNVNVYTAVRMQQYNEESVLTTLGKIYDLGVLIMKRLLTLSMTVFLMTIMSACGTGTTPSSNQPQQEGRTTEQATASPSETLQGNAEMKVHFINVGQGDSILIQTPEGKTLLVDGGKKAAGEKVVAYLKKSGVTTIDRLVATHPDADHIGGLLDVLNEFKVKKVIDSGKDHTSETYIDYLKLVDQKDIPFHIAKTGETVALDPSVNIKVLNSGDTAPTDENNDASVVLKITYNQFSVLLTGDAPIDVEKQMMQNDDVSATVLKPGHHGSETSSSMAFLQAVKPKVAVLSYGENNYGHPNAAVVERLRKVGAKVYSTEASGDIVISTDGKSYSVNAKPWNGKGVEDASTISTDGSTDKSDIKININKAGSEELQSINGIGPALAEHILDYRKTHGAFKNVDALDQVEGIGPATLEKIKPYITLK